MPFRVQVQAQNADFVDTNDTNYDGIKSRKKISRGVPGKRRSSHLKKSCLSMQSVFPALTPFAVSVCTFEKNMANPTVQAFWQIAEREVSG